MSDCQYQWDSYAQVFSAITSRYQVEMYEYTSGLLTGSVLDCGCGTGKIMPYLVSRSRVTSYLGVDSSISMIEKARELVKKLGDPRFSVCHQTIESARGGFSSAVSLQSYYCWPDTTKTLSCIRNLLEPHGTLILASVNEKLDIRKLLFNASKDLLMHEYWSLYERKNLEITESKNIRLATLDELIGEVRATGFKVVGVNTDLFEGGLNLLVLKR